MANSIRETIILKFLSLAAGITVANGYNTNMGSNVCRAEAQIDEASLPAVNVIPGAEEAVQEYTKDHITATVQLEGFVKHGTSNSSVIAEQILADLRKRFTLAATVVSEFWPICQSVRYLGGGSNTYASAGAEVTGFMIQVEVRYITLEGNPYA